MPVYSAACVKCGREEDYFAPVNERNDLVPKCCGKTMSRTIGGTIGFVQQEMDRYISPTTGRVIGNRRERLDDLKRSRARPWEGFEQETKEAARQRGYADQKDDAKLEDATRRAFHQLSPEKRRILEGR
jgi:hypothetical protein